MTSKTMSISFEIDTVRDAVAGARILVEQAHFGGFSDEDAEKHFGPSVSAILTLIECRLRDLSRAARGIVDPGSLLADHNRVIDADAQDLVLNEWTSKKRSGGG